MAMSKLTSPHGVYPDCKIVRVFESKEKEKKAQDGRTYKVTTRCVEVAWMGDSKSFFFSGEDAEADFKQCPAEGATCDIVVPVVKGRDGKPRLLNPSFYPAGSCYVGVEKSLAPAADAPLLPRTRAA